MINVNNVLVWACSGSSAASDAIDYAVIQDSIIIKVLPVSCLPAVPAVLADVIGDLALVPVFLQDVSKNNSDFEFIPVSVFDSFNIKRNIFFKNAIANTEKHFPLFLKKSPLDNIVNDIDTMAIYPESMPMISTLFDYNNGAISIFYPEVCRKISEKWNDSFYIAFVAADCAILHKFGTIEPDLIIRYLKDTNITYTADNKTLTNNLYYYDRSTEHIHMYKTPEYQKYSDIIDCLQFEDYKYTYDLCSIYDVSENIIDYIVDNIDKISYTNKHEFIEKLIEMF